VQHHTQAGSTASIKRTPSLAKREFPANCYTERFKFKHPMFSKNKILQIKTNYRPAGFTEFE